MITIPKAIWDGADDDMALLPPGLVYVEILGASERDDFVDVRYQLLLCPAAPQHVGAVLHERFKLSPAAIGRFAPLAKRAGLQSRGEPNAEATLIDVSALSGSRLIVLLEHSTHEGKTRHQWRWGCYWPKEHPKAPQDLMAQIAALPAGPPMPGPAVAADDVGQEIPF